MGTKKDLDAYRTLVRLIKKGYFSTVLTANVDSTLEDALLENGLRPTAYQTLVVGRDKYEFIANALNSQPSDIRIIKLHGSLSDRIIPKYFPDFFELQRDIRDGLERYLNQDIVIVGSIEREGDIIRSLTMRGGSSIFYALPQEPSHNDDVVRAIEARGNDPNAFLISGPYGYFKTFFQALESELGSNTLIENDEDPSTKSRAEKKLNLDPLKVSPKSEVSRVSTLSPTGQDSAFVPPRGPKMQPSLPLTNSEKRQELTSSRGQQKGAGKESHSVRIMIIQIASGIFALMALLGAVSLFANLTPSFSAIFIIPLVIILAVFILGIMGILNASQITQIFSQGLRLKSIDSKKEIKKIGKKVINNDTAEHPNDDSER